MKMKSFITLCIILDSTRVEQLLGGWKHHISGGTLFIFTYMCSNMLKLHLKRELEGESFLLVTFISKLKAASCITLMFLLRETSRGLSEQTADGVLNRGLLYVRIYVAFSWVEPFKPNKTAPLWPF